LLLRACRGLKKKREALKKVPVTEVVGGVVWKAHTLERGSVVI